jgi:hypothetical protein
MHAGNYKERSKTIESTWSRTLASFTLMLLKILFFKVLEVIEERSI